MNQILTKSKFKLGLECPNKLYFAAHGKEYANQKVEDPFLEALAQGGFQVEGLARLQFPKGVFIDTQNYEYEKSHNLTSEALNSGDVTIFEGAFKADNLFIRADILEKKGGHIKLIEVKAKSYNSSNENYFVGKRGGLNSKWMPYFMDLAYQKYVIQKCQPNCTIAAYFMMADKNKSATINGLNQLFRIPKNGDPRKDIIKRVNSMEEIGESVLTIVDVDSYINQILNGDILYQDKTFIELVSESVEILQDNVYPKSSIKISSCKKCEYKTIETVSNQKSGFVECYSKQLYWKQSDFDKPNLMEIWNFRSGQKLLEEGRLFLNQLNEGDFKIESKELGMSNGERQWIQVKKSIENDKKPFILQDELKSEIDCWDYPFHLIDFETSAVAIPFNAGRRPYEQIAFQFSHHILYQDGTINHVSQYISNEPGVFPNFDFVRHLKQDLEKDNGSIFRYATHENTILNAISKQLLESNEPDKVELIEFIESITRLLDKKKVVRQGERNMVDLKDVIVKYYYNPLTKGSNSIKYVLPAILNTSKFLQDKYTKPISDIGLTSLNLGDNHVWLKIDGSEIISPYKTLPPLFKDWSVDDLDDRVSELENIDNGGAALVAYSRLQFEDMSDKERVEITTALLKYCELDTLAMVMLIEHFLNDLI
jgi:CRISPR/Cas system-associated exonuclease Cas4 (RecB family)